MKEIRILGKPNELTYVTQNWKFTKMKPNLRILENANELINLALSLSNVSIACDSLAEGERLSERGDKPTIMFRPIVVKATMGLSHSERDGGRNIEFGCNPQSYIWLIRTQSMLLRSNENSDSVR